MTKRFAGIVLVALVAAWVGILLTAGDSPAQLYRYTDKNGRIVFITCPTEISPIAQPTNCVVPTDGVLRPSAQLSSITMPNCTGPIPIWIASGRNSGKTTVR